MQTWVLITIAAAFLQNVRSAMQKHLKGVMGTTGATFVRFGFGLPVAALFVLGLNRLAGYPFPHPGPAFLAWMTLGAFSQIGATFLLIHLFHSGISRSAPPIPVPSRCRRRCLA